jgi:hypothetical protein
MRSLPDSTDYQLKSAHELDEPHFIHEGKTVWALYTLPICDAKINLSVRERYFSESVVNPLILD